MRSKSKWGFNQIPFEESSERNFITKWSLLDFKITVEVEVLPQKGTQNMAKCECPDMSPPENVVETILIFYDEKRPRDLDQPAACHCCIMHTNDSF